MDDLHGIDVSTKYKALDVTFGGLDALRKSFIPMRVLICANVWSDQGSWLPGHVHLRMWHPQAFRRLPPFTMSAYVRDPKLWISRRPPSAKPLDTTDDDDPDLPPRPLPNSYWATPTLLASELPGDSRENVAVPKLSALLEVGMTDFFDLTEEWESLPYVPILERLVSEKGGQIIKLDPVTGDYANFFQSTASNGEGLLVRYARFPIRDGSVPSPEVLQSIMDALNTV